MTAFDPTQNVGLSDIPTGMEEITAGTAPTRPMKGFIVSGAGDISVTDLDSNTITLTVLASVQYWIAFNEIASSGTTATGIVGFY